MESSELIELQIGAVANGGWCVARHEGRVVFVRHTLPGERVRARVTQETKNFLRADAVEILEASPDRVQAPCPFAGPGRCGGCDWQHASLPAQRRLKADVIKEQLSRLAGIERDVVVEELPGTPDGLGWRTRVQFSVRRDGAVGLRKHRSHQIEPIDECLIAHPQVEVLGIERKRWPGAAGVEAIASAGTGDRLAVLSSRGRVRVPRMDAPVRLVSGKSDKPPFVREDVAGRLWQVSGSGFWQVHPAAAETFAEAVVEALEPRKGDTAVDLYCGAGLFAGVLGEAVGSDGLVVGIESDGQAVRDARFNLRDLPHVSVERGEVEAVLDQIKLGHGRSTLNRADLVVLDPPRTGAGRDVVKRVAELAGRRIAYVSCDPATLARDLAFFSEHGWTLSALRAFDAFPMTQHVECIATLVKG
ncbi:class I SAM-dependent RNA methyltransferase [Actinoallomurus purpureus]|uniref:class I SAM-dependent RNA methyltransferase n=1 Tax=Actinoallomurus purpureus TaxID=478114 RepID=UPI0020933739|nr:class I SAM-dependent RNA methyltransferase [Actinoallomurus purpureus]MCO6009700.1 class I SAM-dependent RNA methyltransferase [Actinoallomurus purpureus]